MQLEYHVKGSAHPLSFLQQSQDSLEAPILKSLSSTTFSWYGAKQRFDLGISGTPGISILEAFVAIYSTNIDSLPNASSPVIRQLIR